MYLQDTIVAPATAPGRGAVAIVRLSGPDAIAIARRIWRQVEKTGGPAARGPDAAHRTALQGDLAPRRLYLGDIVDPATGAHIDRALIVVMPSPHSFTGEHVAELHCHGGPYIVRRVVGLAMALGARMAEPGEFSRRAFLNSRMELTEAEAIADLVSARSEGALAQALAQLSGSLKERVQGLRAQVIAIRAHLEAEIDFSDEDIALPSRNQIASDIGRLAADITVLHDSFARGRMMREGARATIVGKPNVGKSSILNLLLGIERAIVTPIAGTTRDVIEDSIQLGPHSLVIQDTAGVHGGGDPIEQIGIKRTKAAVDDADLLIAVFDSSRPLEPEDSEIARLCTDRIGVVLANKSDLRPRILSSELRDLGLTMPILPFSAIRADGVSPLREELIRAVEAVASPPAAEHGRVRPMGVGVENIAISRERHRDALARALKALEAAEKSARSNMPPEIIAVDISAAADSLGSITGEIAGEDVLDAVFREFCIGK
ncbi:MAG TPA: tRNA uridine-5-carboxymethylaminomethyl(34) synthesis GTPase MnmE [Candidatus Binataceae bacterium]